jgi:hypothetical protein
LLLLCSGRSRRSKARFDLAGGSTFAIATGAAGQYRS